MEVVVIYLGIQLVSQIVIQYHMQYQKSLHFGVVQQHQHAVQTPVYVLVQHINLLYGDVFNV